MLIGDRIKVGLKFNIPLKTTDRKDHLRRIVRMIWEGLKGRPAPAPRTTPGVAGRWCRGCEYPIFLQPPYGKSFQIIEVLKLPSVEQILFHILKRCFNFPFVCGRPLWQAIGRQQ